MSPGARESVYPVVRCGGGVPGVVVRWGAEWVLEGTIPGTQPQPSQDPYLTNSKARPYLRPNEAFLVYSIRFPRYGQIWVPDCLRIDLRIDPDMTLPDPPQTGPEMTLQTPSGPQIPASVIRPSEIRPYLPFY